MTVARIATLVAAATATFTSASSAAQDAPARAVKAASATAVEVPLILAEGRLLVPVEIEGLGKTFFILDTAASRTVISSNLRDRLTLDASSVRERTVQGSTGSTVMEFVKLPSMKVGGEKHGDLWAVVTDISDFRDYGGRMVTGIIGTDLLSKYDVGIDVPSGVLRLYSPAASAGNPSQKHLPFHSFEETEFVQFTATIDNKPVQALLDTGARRGVLNWKAAGLAGVGPESDGIRKEAGGSEGIGGQKIPQYRYTFDGICLGDHCLPARELRIADLSVFGVVGDADKPSMLIGVEWLKTCPIVISYSTDRLRLCSGGAA